MSSNGNEQCNCSFSKMFPHRRRKCSMGGGPVVKTAAQPVNNTIIKPSFDAIFAKNRVINNERTVNDMSLIVDENKNDESPSNSKNNAEPSVKEADEQSSQKADQQFLSNLHIENEDSMTSCPDNESTDIEGTEIVSNFPDFAGDSLDILGSEEEIDGDDNQQEEYDENGSEEEVDDMVSAEEEEEEEDDPEEEDPEEEGYDSSEGEGEESSDQEEEELNSDNEDDEISAAEAEESVEDVIMQLESLLDDGTSNIPSSAALEAANNANIHGAEVNAPAVPRAAVVIRPDEAVVCASCPEAWQDCVTDICVLRGIQKAYGRAGDMVNSLSGYDWVGKWQAKVVMAAVTKVQTLKAKSCKIICIQGGPHCNTELQHQPLLLQAIRTELGDVQFLVRVEWIDARIFLLDYGEADTDYFQKYNITLPEVTFPFQRAVRTRKPKPPGSDATNNKTYNKGNKAVKPRKPAKSTGVLENTGGQSKGGAGSGDTPKVRDKAPRVSRETKPRRPVTGDDAAGKALVGGGVEHGGQQRVKKVARSKPVDGGGAAVSAGNKQNSAGNASYMSKRVDHHHQQQQQQQQSAHSKSVPAAEKKQSATAAPHTNKPHEKAINVPPTPKVVTSPSSNVDSVGFVFNCGECSRGYKSLASLEQHQATTAHSTLACCGCAKTFNALKPLAQHFQMSPRCQQVVVAPAAPTAHNSNNTSHNSHNSSGSATHKNTYVKTKSDSSSPAFAPATSASSGGQFHSNKKPSAK